MTVPGHVLDRLDDYIDGELSPDAMRLVGTHLSSCDDCAAKYREALHTVETVRRRLRRVAVPPDLHARLRAALRELSACQKPSCSATPEPNEDRGHYSA